MNNRPLSYGQAALWFLQKRFPESSAYHEGLTVSLQHADIDRLDRAMSQLYLLHPMLRCTIGERDGHPFYLIGQVPDAPIVRIDCTGCNDETLIEQINADYQAPFDLARCCIRLRVYLRPGRDPVLSAIVHHIICDGWSLKILWQDLLGLYMSDAPATGATGRISYDAFVAKEAALLQSDQGRKGLEKLRAAYQGVVDDGPAWNSASSGVGCPTAGHWNFGLTAQRTVQLKACCRANGFSAFDLLLSIFKLTIYYFTRQPDSMVGTPFLNRSAEFREVSGLFVNSAGIRNEIKPKQDCRQFVAEVRERVNSMAALAAIPLSEAISGQPVSTNAPGYFNYFFTLRHKQFDISLSPEGTAFGVSALRYTTMERPLKGHAAFDLHLEMADTREGMTASLCYRASLIDKKMAFSFERQFLRMLDRVLLDSSIALERLTALDPGEEVLLCGLGAGDQVRVESGVGVSGLVGRQVERGESRVAVMDGRGLCWSYGQLWERVRSVSGWLRERGVGSTAERVVVGVRMERRCGWLAVVLGIWRAGGTYLPLEPELPAERLDYMAEDAGARWVITDGEWPGEVREGVVGLEEVLREGRERSGTGYGGAVTTGPTCCIRRARRAGRRGCWWGQKG